MKYNDERSNVHVMEKTLLAKFEKWLQLLPKVTEELYEVNMHLEELQEMVVNDARLFCNLIKLPTEDKRKLGAALTQLSPEDKARHWKLLLKINQASKQPLKSKMLTEDKRKLGAALTQLSPEDLSKALEIVPKIIQASKQPLKRWIHGT